MPTIKERATAAWAFAKRDALAAKNIALDHRGAILGAAGGFLVGGPVGMAAGATAGHYAWDRKDVGTDPAPPPSEKK